MTTIKCKLCNTPLPKPDVNITTESIKEFNSYRVNIPNAGSVRVCYPCYALTSIIDLLKEIKDGITR